MGFEGKPEKITDSIKAEDTDYLRAAGRKGAEVTNAKRRKEQERAEIAKLQAEVEAEKREMEDLEMRQTANEHIITPDGEDLDYNG